MKPYLSVVVPIYNVEPFLYRCLESLSKQSLKDIEIICVNDGSTDKSQQIIDDFVAKNSNFKALKKANGGLSDARNFGLTYCTADYVAFIDSDDYVDENHFELMYQAITREKADLVVCDVLYEWEDSNKNFRMKGFSNHPTSAQKALFLSPLFAWNKVYRKSFFTDYDLKYPLGLWYEDIPVTLPIFALSKKMVYVSNTYVHYTQRKESIMGSLSNPKMKDIYQILEMTLHHFGILNLSIQNHDELEYVCIEQLLLYGSFRAYRSRYTHELMDLSFAFMKKHFPHWKRNIYLSNLPFKYQVYLKLLNSFSSSIFGKLIRMRGQK